MNDLISRQALCEYALNQKDKSVTPNDIMRFPSAQPVATDTNVGDTISRQDAIDALYSVDEYNARSVKAIKALPSVQPEEAIPVSWIEAKIERFMMTDDAFGGLTASIIIRAMLNEWKREQEGDTK